MKIRNALLVAVWLALGLCAHATGLDGTYQLVSDSDGNKPKAAAQVQMTLQGGRIQFSAVQPGETVTDSGTYRVNGNRITMQFNEMAFGCRNAPFTQTGSALILPFKCLSDGPGSSTWVRIDGPGGGSSSSGDGTGKGSGDDSSGGSGSSGTGRGSGSSGTGHGSGSSGSGSGSGHGSGSSGSGHSGSGSSGSGSGGSGSSGSGGSAGGRGAGHGSGHGAGSWGGKKDPMSNWVGLWTGQGSSHEVRFRRQKLMSVAVLHTTVFTFAVYPDGTVNGMGMIVYDMDPNLRGVAALTMQVNEAVDMMKYVLDFWKYGELAGKLYKSFLMNLTETIVHNATAEAGKRVAMPTLSAAMQAGYKFAEDEFAKWFKAPFEKVIKEVRSKMLKGKSAKEMEASGQRVGGFGPGYMPGIMNVPGVTKVQYEYKGLANGPEIRTFSIKGRVVQGSTGWQIQLEQDGPFRDGDQQLYVKYTVNMVTEKKPFPCWSPFLKGPAMLSNNTGKAQAYFKETGSHRNGVKEWQEYVYMWSAKKIGD